MSRALVSPTIGDTDRPTNPPFVPPPVQRLSRSFTGFASVPSSKSQSASDRASTSSSQSISSPLPGPNRARSCAAHSQLSSKPSSNIFPRLHRLEIADDMAYSTKKSPLLELRLSSQSFLDAVAMDVRSNKPLYVVETVGSSTTIWRSDPWDGSATIAEIRWPKELPLKGKSRDHTQGPTVQMNGDQRKATSSLLKHSGLGSSRKFQIPHHLHAFKWKKAGDMHTCTTISCKGPIATLEVDSDASPLLKVFESLGFHESMPQLDHAGISIVLLDYLFVTALLLVTEPDDWMTVTRNPAALENRPDTASSLAGSLKTPASMRQWRKIMYGEPLYPSLKTPALDKGARSVAEEDADVLDISERPQLSTSMRQWRKIVYGEPLYPSLRPRSADRLDLPPRPSSANSFSSESGFYPPTPSSAPSTFDVSPLFDDSERERQMTATRVGRENRRQPSPLTLSPTSPSPVPSSECIPLSTVPASPRARRGLPAPPSAFHPPASVQPWLHRSRSSPWLEAARDGSNSWFSSDSLASMMASPIDQDDFNDQSMLTRLSVGTSVRQLPSIPTPQSSSGQTGPLDMTRHARRSLPPTPALMSRSQSVEEDLQPPSQPVAPAHIATSSSARPSTSHSGTSLQNDADAPRRQRPEKDPNQLINWMRNITRAHHDRRRALEDENEVVYEPPPPAYNAIDFSKPPQARSPERT